ncbi:MAG: hypothetical protein JJT96_19260 [Opitutales bacterium]|nr:hypothetical protein [Opitutales bacterium]
MKTRYTALAAAGFCLGFISSRGATEPGWWSAYGVLDASQSGDNYSPVNVGQLMHIASRSKAYFDDELPGGSGTAVNTLVLSFGSGPNIENYAPANVGQLKQVVFTFYQRLAEVFPHAVAEGVFFDGDFLATTGLSIIPWMEADASENWQPANVGQLKLVFSFNIAFLQSAEGILPAWWKMKHFGTLNIDPSADLDQDGQNSLLSD